MENISWENVFNTNHKWHNMIHNAFTAALYSGYPYILWNDKVYDSKTEIDTGFTIEDLK